ncbi:MAG: fumarylacetoacetate hydrolase family protein [Chloroflexi bacterium]|nr:fumarylacetoacetate hydrolase family protein [Chloroflexota bacterium]
MKIATYKAAGVTGTAVQRDDGSWIDVSKAGNALALLSDKEVRAAAAKIVAGRGVKPLKGIKMVAPVTPRALICIGLNYMDHVLETNAKVPEKPVIFGKFANTLANPGDVITWHADASSEVDFEAELGVIIGKKASRVSKEKALSYVGGYTCVNDISARDIQKSDSGGQWILGKTFDGFCPIGPVAVTGDEVGDPQNLTIKCILNGETVQNSNTREMIYNVAHLVSHLSHYMTLMPGDLIATGTPPGVGMGRTPRLWMKNGDVCTIEIEKIGSLTNKMKVK